MISRKDVSGIAPKDLENILPDTASPVSNPYSGDSPFEKLLSASFEQIAASRIDPQTGLAPLIAPAPSLPVSPAPAGAARFREALAAVFKHEGSAYVRKDGGRESSRFGILQSTAREYGYKGDVKNISRADAEAIYKKIWDKSGAAALPETLGLVHFDTYVNSPAAAGKLLKRSGGDPEAYLRMRAQRYTRLAHLRPERYGKYLKGWMNRIASLRNITAGRAAKELANNESNPAGKAEDRAT